LRKDNNVKLKQKFEDEELYVIIYSFWGGELMDVEKVNKTVKVDLKEGLKSIFPEVFEDNKINLEKLKGLLSGEVVEKEDDRFYFNWAGKSNIFKFIQAPAYGTLKPDKEKSIDFENTENIAIIGENLETLKLLLKPYFEKVKMIYIDPPYNTGKDFIYHDNFKEPMRDYLEKTGQIDVEGNKLTTNTEASGRYHSDWLNFIYPRLFLARSLLRDDGVIFVSIDDHEVHHLRMIMDEIFGEENFVGNICWNSTKTVTNTALISVSHTYTLVYTKSIEFYIQHRSYFRLPEPGDGFSNSDNDPRGPWKADPFQVGGERPNQRYPITNPKTGKVYYPNPGCSWKNELKVFEQLLADNRIVFGVSGEAGPQRKRFQFEAEERGRVAKTIWDDIDTTANATRDLDRLFGKHIFDNPKPVNLIKRFAQLGVYNPNESIILDFFAGSGTTGQAVWDLNKEDGGNRKFILVQLDEPVDESTETGKNALSLGLKTVADICIERLKRVSEKYKGEIASSQKALLAKTAGGEIALASPRNDISGSNHDFGFKVFRLDKSNFNLKDEFETPAGEGVEELRQKYLDWLGVWIDQPLVHGWKNIDVVYEVILKEGLNLNSKIEEVKIKNNNFYYVQDVEQVLDFYTSLDEKIDKETIEEIRTAKYKNKMFVLNDSALTDDDKINLTSSVRLKVI
jgi:adenine-specific DNA-methyltransferase